MDLTNTYNSKKHNSTSTSWGKKKLFSGLYISSTSYSLIVHISKAKNSKEYTRIILFIKKISNISQLQTIHQSFHKGKCRFFKLILHKQK